MAHLFQKSHDFLEHGAPTLLIAGDDCFFHARPRMVLDHQPLDGAPGRGMAVVWLRMSTQ